MTADEYADLVLTTRDNLFDAIRTALPGECEMEKRFISATGGPETEDQWVGTLVNTDTDKIRIFVLLMNNLRSADEAATAGAKNFKPSVRLTFELFHDYLMGTDEENTQTEFEKDALRLQYALETNKNLPPLAMIVNYEIGLGVRSSKVRSMHYSRGEIVLNFRGIRYDG